MFRHTPSPFRALALVLLVGVVACSDQAPLAPALETAPTLSSAPAVLQPTGRSVIVFEDETAVPQAGLDLVASLGGTITSRYDGIGVVFAAGLNSMTLQTLRSSALVADAGPDYEMNWLPDVKVGSVVSVEDDGGAESHDPSGAGAFRTWQWGPQRIGADRAWAAGKVGNSSIRVAILDTGIDFLHRELSGLVDLDASRSFVETEPDFDDHHFHGTHVASTVSSNSRSIAGIAPHVTLIAVKVLSFEGSGTFEGVTGGILHAADVGAHVINMSLGAEFDKKEEGAAALIRTMQRARQYAQRKGTLVVSAAGNSSVDYDNAGTLVSIPCMISHLCVSATGPLNGQFDADGPVLTDNHDRLAYYSNYGFRAVHVAAPGGNANPDDPDQAEGTWRNEDLIVGALASRCLTPGLAGICTVNHNPAVNFYVFAGGTSMATPHVSGAAALVQAHFGGTLSPEQVMDKLIGSADDILDRGRDPYSNYGRINVFRALGG